MGTVRELPVVSRNAEHKLKKGQWWKYNASGDVWEILSVENTFLNNKPVVFVFIFDPADGAECKSSFTEVFFRKNFTKVSKLLAGRNSARNRRHFANMPLIGAAIVSKRG